MESPEKLRSLLTEYNALEAAQKAHSLTPGQSQRFELLKDVLLELGAIRESEESKAPARLPRAPVALEVSFGSAGDAARSVTRDVGLGGLAIATNTSMPRGTVLQLQLRVPGWNDPVPVTGEVVWCREGALGISFTGVRDEDQKRIRQLVLDNTPLLSRLKSALGGDGSRPVSAKVSGGTRVLLKLSDAVLFDVAAEVLGLEGFLVFDAVAGGASSPQVLVADTQNLAAVVEACPCVPIVAVNATGPESLVGRLSFVRPKAFIRRPASAAKIVEAIRSVLPAK